MHQCCPFKSLLDRFEGVNGQMSRETGALPTFPSVVFSWRQLCGWLTPQGGSLILHSGPRSREEWKLCHGGVLRPVAETENNSEGL